MRRGQRLIPRTVTEVICETIYDYHVYILDNFVFPPWVYKLVRIYVSLSTCLMFLNFYESGTGLKPLEGFLHLYAKSKDESSAMINFIVDLIIYFIMFISITTFSILYTQKSNLNRSSTVFNVFLIEIIAPILLLVTASQIGNNAGLLVNNLTNYTLWVFTIILAICLIVTIIALNFFLYSYIPFVPGRSVALSAEAQGLEINMIILIRVLGRIAITTVGTKFAIAVRVVLAIIIGLGILIVLFWNIFHNKAYSALITGALCGSFVMNIINIFVHLDWVFRLFIFTFSVILGEFISRTMINVRQRKVREIFDALQVGELDIEDVYPDLGSNYLRHCYEAFKMGHPYYMTFKPIAYGARNVKTTSKIWRFYLRTLAIYHSKKLDLIEEVSTMKKLEFNDIRSKLFIKGINHIIETRSNKATKQCNTILKGINTQTRNLKTTLIRYWEAVENGEVNSAYAYGSSAHKQMEEIDRMYKTTLSKWPMVQNIYKYYSHFLSNVCFNRLQAESYAMLGKMQRNIDMFEIRAKRCFLKIPMVLTEDKLNSTQPSNNEASMMSASSASSLPHSSCDIEKDDNEEVEMAMQNSLHEMGKKAKVGINLAITCFIIAAFAILFILGIVCTDFVFFHNFNIFKTLLQYLSCFTQLSFFTSRVVYKECSLVFDALNISYNQTKTYEMIAHTQNEYIEPIGEQIVKDINSIMNNIDTIESLRPATFPYIGNVTYFMTAVKANWNYIYKNNVSEVKDQKAHMPFLSAMNLMISFMAQYYEGMSKDAAELFVSRDFMFMVENNYRVNNVIDRVALYVSDRMSEFTHNAVTTAFLMSVIGAAASILILPIAVILLKIQSKQYAAIIDAMHKIPSIVIIQHIDDLSSKCDKDECKSVEKALHMQDSSGIPICNQIVVVFLLILSFIAIMLVNYAILTRSKDQFTVLPYQIRTSAGLANHIYDQLASIKRTWAVNAGKPVNADGLWFAQNIFKRINRWIDASSNDAVYGKTENNISYGYLVSKSASRNIFFQNRNNNGTNYHDMLIKFGYIFSLEVNMAELDYFVGRTAEPDYFNKDNIRLQNLMHFNDIHFSTEFLDSLIENTIVDTNEEAHTMKRVSILIPIVDFIMMAFFTIIFILYQMKILATFRFTIMSLSMLDQKFIQSNQKLLDIIAGDFTSDGQSDSIPSHYVDCLKESSSDAIFLINENMEILETNKPASKICLQYNNAKNIEDILIPPEELREVVKSSTPLKNSFVYTFHHEHERPYNMDINATKCVDGEIFVIMHRDIAKEKLQEEREMTETQLKNIIHRIIPHDFREPFSENPFKQIGFENILIFAVKASNIAFTADDTTDESLQNALTKMKIFNKAVYESAKLTDDCVVVKKHNFAQILCFNIKMQKKSIQQPLLECLDVLKHIRMACDENGIKVSASIVFSRSVFIGIPSINKASFNIFANEFTTLMRYLDSAQDGEFRITRIERDLPAYLRDKVRQVDDTNIINIDDI